MYIKTFFLLLASMAIAAHGKVSCPQGLQSSGSFKCPTNIVSSKAVLANVTTPAVLFNGVFNILRFKNLGNGVEAYPNEAVDATFVTGGVLCKKIYKLHKLRYNINPDGKSRAGNLIDGKGTPLEVEIIYYNIEYGSFKNALNRPDGVLIITFQIVVGPVFNPLFVPLQFLLSAGLIKKPGSQIFIPSPVAYIWFDVIALITKYYAYPGTYLDLETGKSYPALRILPTPALAPISYSQFAAFRNIFGYNGEPISTVEALNPLAGRPVSLAFGFGQGLLPF